MNNRLQKFLDAENITQSQFADTVGVARASVSHILSGRNKPGFDFIESISIHYPELNLEWLINGKGKMYKNAASQSKINAEENTSPRSSLFSDESDDKEEIQDEKESSNLNEQSPIPQPAVKAPVQKQMEKQSAPQQERTVSKIIVFFSDGTYQEIP